MASEAPSCSNTDCRIAETEKCIEGYSLADCPHYGRPTVQDIEVVDDAAGDETVPEATDLLAIPLSLGEALDRAGASNLQRRRLSRTVGIVGPQFAGKTSLMASVYEILQEGGVAGYTFAGSSTLFGFEMICHDARAASRRTEPHTERTTGGADATFFHLDLGNGDPEAITSLFIGDRSGEDYLAATDDLTNAAGFFELRRADVVTLLVNGEQLADQQLRHETRASTPQIIDALFEAGSIGARQRLAVVLTKKDAVTASAHADRVNSDFEEIVGGIKHLHGHRVADVAQFVVAASPRIDSGVKRGEGVDALLEYWMRPTASEPLPPHQTVQMERMIDRVVHDVESDE